MRYWTIIGTIASIIAAVAAIIAAYFAFLSRPQKVKDLIVDIESVQRLQNIDEREIEFAVANLDENNVLHDAMVFIKTEGFGLIRIVPKSAGGSLMMPDVVLEENSVNFCYEKIKPRTKKVAAIRIKAKPGLYNLTWHGYGPNLNAKEGNLKLELDNSECMLE